MIEYTVKVYSDGIKQWYLNDQLHREDGPAIEYANGIKYWFLNDQLHREDGPAIEWADGDKSWFLNGKLHREDGPAIEGADGSKCWYLNDQRLTEEKHSKATSKAEGLGGSEGYLRYLYINTLKDVEEMTMAEVCEELGRNIKIKK